ncbi:FYVE-domain-containing protein [Pseudovirgaria hyperparasitica]|uniref:RING-type E3 ubiquitin transferase n=1 Tax=Pseudovirgaria hyperparasitica TaxID=470096 RepID=A0A6A6W2S9_9PEZI|nr:FYVE-domain-containing protein [Pseudovirgaria hyperparasitica]KAF2755341.1 FYVE-domain-containing protein [Pseudovirgaria hyperparasitica]
MHRNSQSSYIPHTSASSSRNATTGSPQSRDDQRRLSVREGYEHFRRADVDSRAIYHPQTGGSYADERNGETWLDFIRNREEPEASERVSNPAALRSRRPAAPAYLNTSGHREGTDARKRRLTAPESPGRRHGNGPPHSEDNRAPGVISRYRPSIPLSYSSREEYVGRDLQNPSAMEIVDSMPQNSDIADQPSSMSTDFSALEPPGRNDVILPLWQPDHEVSKCPICGNFFGLFYRRHHCRKCGRVVCANCSPHRITIPRQFVVHPPSPTSGGSYFNSDLDDIGGNPTMTNPMNNPALGGGDEVRVCNPCVPDPNLSPPPQQHRLIDGSTFPNFWAEDRVAHQQRENSHTSTRHDNSGSSPMPSRSSLHRPSYSISGPSVVPPNIHSRPRNYDGRTGLYQSSPTNSQNSTSQLLTSSLPQMHRYQHMNRQLDSMRAQRRPIQRQSSDANAYFNTTSAYNTGPDITPNPFLPDPSSPLHAHTSHPMPAQQRPQIAEEDECPICQQELPPKGPDGSETEREAHVMDCIASNFVPSSTPSGSAAAMPSPSILAGTAVAPPMPSPRQNAAPARSSSTSDAVPSSSSRPRRQTASRMLLYRATEKDCFDKDGDIQECVICFEEFAEGDEMGRLECLCKFHKTCIRKWWETKGQGSCPTHQLHG